jgi:neutral ceramidase
MISATHTHTAPQIRPRFVTKADESARRKTTTYVASLPSRIAEAVQQANAQLVQAQVYAAVGHEETISFNRRFLMRDGNVQTNPGKEDPAALRQILRPDGPIDPDVGVVTFDTLDGQHLATLVNFAIHLDTMGGSRPSADFPFQINNVLASARGADMLTVFAMGAAGNINHYDLLDPESIHRVKGVEESSRIGAILAAEVLRSYRRMHALDTATLRVAREVVRLNMPDEKGRALAARYAGASQFFDGELTVFNENGKQQFEAEVQAIALGDELAWVGFPGEMFVEHGLALKQASPFRYTMIHTLANGSIGYVPNRKAYSQGAYEDTATRCAPGEGESLVEVATRLLVSLKQPQRP